METLLDFGADPDGPSLTGTRFRSRISVQPLLQAVDTSRPDIVALLLERGATLAGRIINNELTLLKRCENNSSDDGLQVCKLLKDAQHREAQNTNMNNRDQESV